MKYFLSLLICFMSSFALATPVNVATLVSNKITTGAGTSYQLGGTSRSYFAFGSTVSGSGACAMKVQVSNDNITFIDLATISLTLSSTVTADGLATLAPWKYARGNIGSISGTGAKCSLIAGSSAGN